MDGAVTGPSQCRGVLHTRQHPPIALAPRLDHSVVPQDSRGAKLKKPAVCTATTGMGNLMRAHARHRRTAPMREDPRSFGVVYPSNGGGVNFGHFGDSSTPAVCKCDLTSA